MCNCKCNKNGADVQDFLLPAPGGTETDATYVLGLTHNTCGARKMLLSDPAHPVTAALTATAVGTPVNVGNGTFCQECLVSGTVTYKPCGSCEPHTEYVSYQCCLPCPAATSPTLAIGTVAASPKPITFYQTTSCGCCHGTMSCTNKIAITTSINVTAGT